MYALALTLLFIGIGWFVILRPQQERLRQQRQMQTTLAVGDDVVSAGGIFGTVTRVDDETIDLEIAPQVVIQLARPAVVRRIEPADLAPEMSTEVEPPTEPDSTEPGTTEGGTQA